MTLNQLKNKLIDFYNSHAQVKTVKYEDDFDFNAERNLAYPIVNIEWESSTIQDKTTFHRFKFVLGDRVDDNVEGMEDEVFSDSMEIAEDFFSWLQVQEGFNFRQSSSIQKFSDDTSDRVSGIVFRLDLGIIRRQNECETPVK